MIIDASSGGVAIGTGYATNVTTGLDISDNSLIVEGNVGIGTNNPTSSLHVHKSENSTLSISSDNGNKSYLRLSEYYNGLFNTTGGFLMFDGTLNAFHIGTTTISPGGDSIQMTILKDSKYVGIGTTDPNSKLNVHHETQGQTIQSWSYISTATGSPVKRDLKLQVPTDFTDDHSPYIFQISNALQFKVNNAPALSIDASKKIGIGTDDPECLLHITSTEDSILKITGDNTNDNSTYKHPYLIFQQDGNHNEAGVFLGTHDTTNNTGDGNENDLIISACDTNGGNIYFKTGGATSGTGTNINSLKDATTRMMISNSGNVGIGSTSTVSGYMLYVAGDVQATAYNATSDIRHKENVCDLENALEKINAIRGVNFNFKDDDKIHSGIIAQEVADIIPEAICKSDDEKWSANYNTFIGYLIESVKSLSKENETIKQENENLKTKVNTLETKMDLIMQHLNL
jgi:hypothetical protein